MTVDVNMKEVADLAVSIINAAGANLGGTAIICLVILGAIALLLNGRR